MSIKNDSVAQKLVMKIDFFKCVVLFYRVRSSPLEPETIVVSSVASYNEEPFDEAVSSLAIICDLPRLYIAAQLLIHYLMETVGGEEPQPEAVPHKAV